MTRQERARLVWLAVGVGAFTWFAHWPCVLNGFVHWDDPFYLEPAKKAGKLSLPTFAWAFTAVRPVCYHPLTLLSHVLDFQLWGTKLSGHHAASVALHGLNAGLVVLLLWMLTERFPSFSPAERLWMAGGVGLAFGIHPLQVESVAWLAERQTVLCGLFSLASLCVYWKAVTTPSRPAWWVMTGLFGAALLSKPMAVSLPGVMLALDFFPLRRHQTVGWWRLCREKLILIAGSLALGTVTLAIAVQLGDVTSVAKFTLFQRFMVASCSVVFYWRKLLWPIWLSPFYPLEGKLEISDPVFVVPAVVVTVVTLLGVGLYKRAPWVLAAWIAFLAWIIPVSGMVQTGAQAAADRFMYLAMLPVLAMLGGAVVWLCRRIGTLGHVAIVALVGCEMLLFGFKTREQIAVWRSDETLWTAAFRYFPDSVMVNWELALALMRQYRYEEARDHAEKAARLTPGYGPLHATLGEIYVKTDQYPEAVAELEEALRLKPDLHEARYALACVYSRLHRFDDAYRALQDLLHADPSYAGPLATDEELSDLRQDRDFSARVTALLRSAGAK